MAKTIRIKDYKNLSKESFLSALNKLDNFIKHNIRKRLYEIENTKNLSKSKIKEIDQNLTELKENFFKFNKYYDDLEYKGIRDKINLFDEVDQNYYKRIKTESAFNGNYIEHHSKGDKDKKLIN